MAELLADHTTLRVGGPARRWVEADTEQALISAVADADAAGEPVLLLSGGSNMVVSDDGFDGVVVHVATRGIGGQVASCDLGEAACGGIMVDVAAGENWSAFVDWTVASELVGVEALAGIPGTVGSTPIQNVGAYGQDVSQTLWHVRTWDRRTRSPKLFSNADCAFGYRSSRFKAEPDRYVVLGVTFQLTQGTRSSKVRYAELANRVGVEVGHKANLAAVRDAVLALRRGKGMVLDAEDHDTWSAGSFFTNPVVTPEVAAALPPEAPRFDAGGGLVKSSAAWLIDHAGFGKGYGVAPVTLSTKHALAITNRGGARADEVIALAREIRDGVEAKWGVRLVPEPVFVGVSLD
ncbi:UDP-N-acetylmuramate dehydrogenase [Propioniciclava flava]|uniref:UDP-N-acetylmuramate dehydrogenase n=1 Tax=Propioniciclava flava TaxID=2072026 RepID=UPI001F4F906F|nr:UDP-N-acetylmuramate dehydrogenase [Propioniciclava flava]